MVTRKSGYEKQEREPVFTIKLADRPIFGEACASPPQTLQ
jgi:hypothetical protein